MTRLLLDTCAVIDLIMSPRTTELEFWDIFDDPETMPYISFALLSSDQKFAFYRNQGLDLLEY